MTNGVGVQVFNRKTIDRCGADQRVDLSDLKKKDFAYKKSELQVFLQLVSTVKA